MKWIMLLILSGCVQVPSNPKGLKESSIELDYFRGGHQHRFVATGLGDWAKVELKERTNVKQGKIEKEKFEVLLSYAQSVIEARDLKGVPSCRSPFVLKVSRDSLTKKVEGCRTDEDAAALGRLIRDAEFLMISSD